VKAEAGDEAENCWRRHGEYSFTWTKSVSFLEEEL